MSVSLDTTNALISVDADDLKYFGVAVTDDEQIDKMRFLVNSFSAMFNRETRRLIKARSLTEYYDGDGTRVLFVDNYPINSIDKLYIDSSRVFAASSEIASANYFYDSDRGRIVVPDTVFAEGFRTVKLISNGGFSTIPWDIRNAAREFAKWAWKRDEANAIGVSAATMMDQNITYRYEELPKSVQRVIDLYRRPHGYLYAG